MVSILMLQPWSQLFVIRAIQSGDIQITDAYSTDPELARYDLQVLEDDKQLFPTLSRAPLMKEALLKETSRVGNSSQ